jgi:hypothetical protein
MIARAIKNELRSHLRQCKDPSEETYNNQAKEYFTKLFSSTDFGLTIKQYLNKMFDDPLTTTEKEEEQWLRNLLLNEKFRSELVTRLHSLIGTKTFS